MASTLLLAAGRGTLAAAARHPKPLFGIAAFGVVFSFIAANALWYQPGGHPHPFLATRDNSNPNAIAGYRPMRPPAPENVTTFRIERADPNAAPAQPAPAQQAAVQPEPPVSAPLVTPRPAAQPEPSKVETARIAPSAPAKPAVTRPANAPAVNNSRGDDPIAAAIRSSERSRMTTPPADIPNTGSTPARVPTRANVPLPLPQTQTAAIKPSAAAELVLQIQRGLSNIAYADVEVDGVAGSQTRAAIRRFEKHYRLPETGEPNEMVLRKLRSIGAL